jgi:hypothetical protein
VSSTLRKPPGSLRRCTKFRTFRDVGPTSRRRTPARRKRAARAARCSPVANNYGAGPDFTPDPSCRLHGGLAAAADRAGAAPVPASARTGSTAARASAAPSAATRGPRSPAATPAYRERRCDRSRRASSEAPRRVRLIAASRRGVPLTEEHRLKISFASAGGHSTLRRGSGSRAHARPPAVRELEAARAYVPMRRRVHTDVAESEMARG